MKRLAAALVLLSTALLAGAAYPQSDIRPVPTSAGELAAAAQTAGDHARADPTSAISSGLEVWADLTEVMTKFPQSPEAAEIRARTSGLGALYNATRETLAAALADDVFAVNSNPYYILGGRSEILLETFLRLDLRDHAIALIDATDYSHRDSLQVDAIDYFVAAGDIARAQSAARGDIALQDRIARRLLATKGPAAALRFLEQRSYDKALELKIATLAAIAHGLDATDEIDRAAAADALTRAKDIASGLTEAGPNVVVALAGLGLGDMARHLARSPEDQRLVIQAMLISGYFVEATALALEGDSDADTAADIVAIAAAQAARGNLTDAEATLDRLDQAKLTSDQRAAAFVRIGKINDAIAIGESASLETATWSEILAAVAAHQGREAAEAVAATHSVDLDSVKEPLAIGLSLNDPGAAIVLAGDDAELLLKIADALTARGNYAGSETALTAALGAPTPANEYAVVFTSDIQGRLLDIELKIGKVADASLRLPYLRDDKRLQQFLVSALKAELFDQAALAVQKMPATSIDNEPDQTDGWWQVAIAVAAREGTEAARTLLDERLHIDPTSGVGRWVAVLAAAHDRFALIDLLKRTGDTDPTDRAIVEIAILNLL